MNPTKIVLKISAEDLARAYALARATKPRLKRDRGMWWCASAGTPRFTAATPVEAYLRWARGTS